MEKIKYSPGPWTFKADGEVAAYIKSGDGQEIAIPCRLEDGKNNDQKFGEYLANGILLASAPDLLDTLKMIKNIAIALDLGLLPYKQKNQIALIFDKAQRAIAKAEGE